MKKYSKKQIEQTISFWQSKLDEADYTPYAVSVITDKDELKTRKQEIFDLVQASYSELGGFRGAKDPRNLIRDTDLAKFVFDENGKIVALALYRQDLDGNKRFCSATDKSNPRYKEAHQEIIKSDIEPYDGWYFTAASGKNEHYFKKFNGNPIPNHIAVEVLHLSANPTLKLDPDGVHFSYMTKGDDPIELTKMMFGFNNEAMYNRVITEISNYGEFKLSVDSIEKRLNESLITLPTHLEAECLFVSELFDLHNSGDFNELSAQWERDLDTSLRDINDFMSNGNPTALQVRRLNSVLRRGQICKDEMEPMKAIQVKA